MLVVGAGPAGLSAAMALRAAGRSVTVLDREPEAGGIPRHCDHYPYGLREFGRPMKGPEYARRVVDRARAAGVAIRAGVSVVAVDGARLTVTSDARGVEVLEARRVILATGVRETSRAARLIGGTKPGGVVSTGALQGLVHLERRRPFRRPVVLGTELVAFSALLTCATLGIRPAAMVEPGARATARWPSLWLPRLMGVPVHLNARLASIEGAERVEAVVIETPDGPRRIPCDGVITSGLFRPEATLARMAGLSLDPGSLGPVVDQWGRTSDPLTFACGNLLRPVETAGWSFREGAAVGMAVDADLRGGLPAGPGAAVAVGPGLRFAVPGRLVAGGPPPALDRLQLRADRPVKGRLTVRGPGGPVLSRRIDALPERRITIPLRRLPRGAPLAVSVEATGTRAARPA